MSKVFLTSRVPATYNRQTFYEILNAIQEQINRQVDGYLFPVTMLTSADSPYTVNVNESILLADTTSGNITINLPAADQMKEKRLIIKKIASANTVTVTPVETIDNAASLSITTQYLSYDLVSDGSEWWIV